MISLLFNLLLTLLTTIPLEIILFIGNHWMITLPILVVFLIYLIIKKKGFAIVYYLASILLGYISYYYYNQLMKLEDESFRLGSTLQTTLKLSFLVIPSAVLIFFVIKELLTKEENENNKKVDTKE